MDKQNTLKANAVLCLVSAICSFLPLSILFHILIQMTLVLICYICYFIMHSRWKKEYSGFLKQERRVEQKKIWNTGNKKIDDLYILSLYWIITSFLIPFFGIFWVAKGLAAK